MPKGPLGFPRLTSIGPLVTDGGERTLRLGDVGRVTDPDMFGGAEMVEVVRLSSEGRDNKVDVEDVTGSGRYSVTKEELLQSVNFP